MFVDRQEAGRRLALALAHLAAETPVVLGVPRGGVIVAAEVARGLGAPLDVVVARKIGHPAQPEYAAGAVDASGRVVRGMAGVDDLWFAEEGERQRAEAERRERVYRAGREPVDVAGRTAVIVDDGIATGLTLRAAVAGVRERGAAKVVVAAPVAAPDAVEAFEDLADECVVLAAPGGFRAVGAYYDDFGQTTDAEVLAALAAARA